MKERVRALLEIANQSGCSSYYASDPASLFYLTGVRAEGCALIINDAGLTILSGFIYYEDFKRKSKTSDFNIVSPENNENLTDAAVRIINEHSGNRFTAFDPLKLSFSEYGRISRKLGKNYFKPLNRGVGSGFAVKTSSELKKIIMAAAITKEAVKTVARKAPGEYSEKRTAAEIDYVMRKLGAEGSAFDTIVLSGKRSALPHGTPGKKLIDHNTSFLIDAGARYGGMSADSTRTFMAVKAAKEMKIIYEIVETAQKYALEKVRHGEKCSIVDKAARSYITDKGYGRFFGHGTGHGTGFAVHEYPSISLKSEAVLTEGMVVTVEPGIYIPGKGGIRLEEQVVVQKNGCRIISK